MASKRLTAGLGLGLGLACLASIGCSGEALPGEENLGAESDALYGGGVFKLWKDMNIPVCFVGTGNDALKTRARTIIEDTWSRTGKVKFTGFGTCGTSQPNTIRVSFSSTRNGGFADLIGRSDSRATGIELGTTLTSEVYRFVVIHEFGHALGFVHEQERPDNFPAGGPPICSEFDGTQRARSGGVNYTPFDEASVMNYCSNPDPQELSPLDRAGLRDAYGSNAPEGCQRLSDSYGIVANQTFGFAPAGVISLWKTIRCNTVPSSPDTCQKASDNYGIVANVTFGAAPKNVQSWWVTNKCNTQPRDSRTACQRASETYGIIANETFGAAPTEVRDWWVANNCNTAPMPQSACQGLSDFYGIRANVTFGWAPTDVQTYWAANGCAAKPIQASTCQQLSDVFGLSPADPKAAAPTAARTAWTNNRCTTTPQSAATCQRASDLYGISAGVTFGFAPTEVQDWWKQKACSTKPTGPNACQIASERFGIIANVTFGAAPQDVRTWWANTGCNTKPLDRLPMPG